MWQKNSAGKPFLWTRRPALASLAAAGLLAAATGALIRAGESVTATPGSVPRVVDPGPPGGPPADAIVLVNGKDLSPWRNGNKWIVKDGYVIADKEDLYTKQAFGDCQLHVEWAEPAKVEGQGQGRGNSGVVLMGLYELQVLDSYDNPTYPNGQCGALYNETPPLVNVSRKPGQWQTYRHRLARAAVRRRRPSHPQGHHHPCCKTACWSWTTSSSSAALTGAGRPATSPTRKSSPCCCSTTAIRCVSATSGFASCPGRRKRPARSRP